MTDWVAGGDTRDDDSAEILFQSFLAGGPCEQFWHGQGCPLFHVVPSADHDVAQLQIALKDSFEEAVVTCDMPGPCMFLSLDRCQNGFLWTYKAVDLPPHSVVGLVLNGGDAEKFPHALSFEGPDLLFSESTSRVHVSQP